MNSANKMNNKNNSTLALTDPKRIVVGLCFVQNPSPWWVPPGLMETQGPNAKPTYYRPVSFAADREYGPEEGWQIYRTRRARRNARRRNRDDDNYDFDDSY
jgi:hypothetical protein